MGVARERPSSLLALAVVLACGCLLAVLRASHSFCPAAVSTLLIAPSRGQAAGVELLGGDLMVAPQMALDAAACPTTAEVAASPWAKSCYHVTKACVDQGKRGGGRQNHQSAGASRLRAAARARHIAIAAIPFALCRHPHPVRLRLPAQAQRRRPGAAQLCGRGQLRAVHLRLPQWGAPPPPLAVGTLPASHGAALRAPLGSAPEVASGLF